MSDSENSRVERCIAQFTKVRAEFQYFADNVTAWLSKCETGHMTGLPDVYAVKSRLKDVEHLREKLRRKPEVCEDNFFDQINDLAGVRVLHLWPSQFAAIDRHIKKRIGNDWQLHEAPKAYTWDPETKKYFLALNLDVEEKESYYTSVHYVVKPNNESAVTTCEIQVRSLLEEVWGEIDHSINYPAKTAITVCSDQLLVLAKLIGAGSRLISSIESSHRTGSTQDFLVTPEP
jgi:putative GTP pyrophosphokinase